MFYCNFNYRLYCVFIWRFALSFNIDKSLQNTPSSRVLQPGLLASSNSTSKKNLEANSPIIKMNLKHHEEELMGCSSNLNEPSRLMSSESSFLCSEEAQNSHIGAHGWDREMRPLTSQVASSRYIEKWLSQDLHCHDVLIKLNNPRAFFLSTEFFLGGGRIY